MKVFEGLRVTLCLQPCLRFVGGRTDLEFDNADDARGEKHCIQPLAKTQEGHFNQ